MLQSLTTTGVGDISSSRPPLRMVSVAGRYASWRTILTLAAESLWLLGSSIALVVVKLWIFEEPLDWLFIAEEAGTLSAIYLTVFYLMDLYDLDLVTPRRILLLNLTQAVGLLCIAMAIFERVGLLLFPARWVLMHLLVTVVFMLTARALIDRFIGRSHQLVHFGLVGGAAARAELERETKLLEHLRFGVDFVAETIAQARVLLWHSGLHEKCQRLVLDDAQMNQPRALGFIQECKRAGIEVEELSAFRERAFGKVGLGQHLIHELSMLERGASRRAMNRVRRLRDILLAALGLLITLPLSLVIAAGIKCDSRGPVLFAQDRIGMHGRKFRMIKFRSMYAGACALEGPAWTTQKDDRRVTRVGALIRKLHLDELPQLINVIKGDMSLLGPRPFHPLHVAELQNKPCFNLRQLVLPGITGWAQVRCNYSASLENYQEVLAHDLYYVKHAGLLFDLLIIADTFRVCLWRRGAR